MLPGATSKEHVAGRRREIRRLKHDQKERADVQIYRTQLEISCRHT